MYRTGAELSVVQEDRSIATPPLTPTDRSKDAESLFEEAGKHIDRFELSGVVTPAYDSHDEEVVVPSETQNPAELPTSQKTEIADIASIPTEIQVQNDLEKSCQRRDSKISEEYVEIVFKSTVSPEVLASSTAVKVADDSHRTQEPTAVAQTDSTSTQLKTVLLPDLFVSFISEQPVFHPELERAKRESEDFFLETMKWDAMTHKRHCKGDFAYFAAIFCTEAAYDDFRIIVDWCNWVFPFDDQFDEDGPMRGQYDTAKAELDAIYSVMTDHPVPYTKDEHPLRFIMQRVWDHVAKKGSKSTQSRFRAAMANYFDGVLKQVITDHTDREVDHETFLLERRQSIGVYPVLHLIAFWRGLDLPDYVFEDKAIQEIEQIVCDIVILQNEILSYQKEYFNGDDRNIVARFRKDGLSQQEAYNKVDSILRDCYRRWYIAHSQIPCWGEDIDRQVYKYLKGCKDLCIANLDWSYRTQRYFGKQNNEVRRTRLVTYLP